MSKSDWQRSCTQKEYAQLDSRDQFRLYKKSPGYWTAVFKNSPINLVDLDTIKELSALIGQIESDPNVAVVVFESADPEYFMAHWDLSIETAVTASMPPGPTGLHPWPDVLVRLSKVPVLTIAAIRGCARGAGSEFALACDVRFASRERAVLGQFEVGSGAVPGGGPMARLSRLVGRGRALEIIIGADDISSDLAERYGYVNRSVADAELDSFVDAFARRVAGFEKTAIAEAKALIDEATLPPLAELAAGIGAFFKSVGRPATQARAMALFKKGLQTRSDVELRLGRHLTEYAA